ncbi:PREDICTED: COMM domain-containing protein 1-like [Branchiostoma belcheri]|uniref:COMM domain-containing protein 1 n=1 Tax=Branchiostoma belcheri TaxID=7741 RepID=A0A6P4XD88_BRABE|nr:PREDICTED: COMM domain-containing protein 1-like [Branchiostoma belcheri]KAI8507761.1 negative regulation of sodium ion transmembrane transport [Branchiostoma belcheri]
MAESSKSFLGLLNGLARRSYYGDENITDGFLKEELYPEMPEGDFEALLSKCNGLIKSMVSADMDFKQLEAFATSQTKRKQGGITEEEAQMLTKFWKTHKSKIHQVVVSRCAWNNKLKDVSWRIDLKMQAKHVDQINQPTAIVELQVQNGEQKESNVVRFEMDEERLSKVVKDIEKIEEQINAHCQK